MHSPESDSTACASCLKTQGELAKTLKRCAKCRLQWYCSRECQKSDWKKHKKTCGNTRAEPNSQHDWTPPTVNQNNPNAICYIPKPFTALDNGTWLHNRPKSDVYKLLVDTYRMRLEDEYVFQGEVEEDSLYSGAGVESALRHFRRFLKETIKLDATRNKKLLPEWWSRDSLKECMDFAMTDDFSNVGYSIEKHDIQDHYGQTHMPMQLRMFSEKIDGTLAAGMSCEPMLKLQMEIEKGHLTASHISM